MSKSSLNETTDGALTKDHNSLGAGIRAERLRQGLTLAQVAERAGLTASALSQIERGVIDPSIGSLRRISAALQVPFVQFLVEAERPSPLVRKADRRKIAFPNRDVSYQIILPSVGAPFEFHALELGPGASSRDIALGHDGDECALVLRVEVDVELAGELHHLAEGDSIFVERYLPHRTINRGPEMAEVLVVISPSRC